MAIRSVANLSHLEELEGRFNAKITSLETRIKKLEEALKEKKAESKKDAK